MSKPVTHEDLVARGEKWLRGTFRCFPVFTEHTCWATSESPDVFGINAEGSIVVECKVSVSDFYADQRKEFRANPAKGMGRLRYYLTPPGLISPERLTLAPRWGLAEVGGRVVKIVKQSEVFEQSSNAECLLLRSAWMHKRDFVSPAAAEAAKADPQSLDELLELPIDGETAEQTAARVADMKAAKAARGGGN